MINFLLKYLGVYGLLGVVALAIIVPGYVVYNNLDGGKSVNDTDSASEVVSKNTTEDVSAKIKTKTVTEIDKKSISKEPLKIETKEDIKAKTVSKSTMPQEEKEIAKLLIDVFRVDELGNIITAGKISEKAEIEIIDDNNEILGSAETEGNGDFVVFGKIQGTGLVQTVKVRGLIRNETEKKTISSENLFFVLPKVERSQLIGKKEKIEIPSVIKDDGKDLKVMNPIKPNFVESITLDTISYREDSVAVLAGRARADNFVRIYLDNVFVIEAKVDEIGGWVGSLEEVDSGVYTLRLDEVNQDGKVRGRLELPFKRESESLIEAMGEGSITVQPGNSLWRIARKYYGRGIQYIDIFERNSHLIKDADLIYPGQIFSLPN